MRSRFLLAVFLVALASGARAQFYDRGPYRATVPRPDAVLGFPLATAHTTFREQERVVLAIAAAAPDRVKLIEYGQSVERRPLRLAIVTSPENHRRLEAIRADLGRLADPRGLSEGEAERLLMRAPACVWINHGIHGNESASFETALATLYTLAASEKPELVAALRQTIVVLNPAYNPDGHERFVVWYNSLARGEAERDAAEKGEPWAIAGRGNHYRFDLNRDKLAQSQDETRAETAAFLAWHPQVYADLHGQPETYFFPPNAQAIHARTDRARVARWTERFGKANAAAFDRFGWNYVTRETFDLFYPGYLDSFATLSGAIGMTYETDGGGNLARRRRDGTVATLRDAAARHFEATLATWLTAAREREALLRDFLAYRRAACTPDPSEKTRRVVVLPGNDPGRAARLAGTLLRLGIEVHVTKAPFAAVRARRYGETAAGAKEFPEGALVVEYAQPQGALARAVLEPDAGYEAEFVREQLARRARNEARNENEPREEYAFYDLTGWSLPFASGLDAWALEEPALSIATRRLVLGPGGADPPLGRPGGVDRVAKVAYVFSFDCDAAGALAIRLQQEGFRLMATAQPLKLAGRDWPRGAIFARVERNPATLHARIAALAIQEGVRVQALDSGYGDGDSAGLGAAAVTPLRAPRIAVALGEGVSLADAGALWHYFERDLRIAFTLVPPERLRGRTLERFNVVVLPAGSGYAQRLGKEGVEDLKAWLRRGGALIGWGDSGAWLAEKEVGLLGVSRVGAEADKESKKTRPAAVPDAMARAMVDTSHFLGYGYVADGGVVVAPVSGNAFWKPTKTGANPVTFGPVGALRLSGWFWPENTETLLAGTAFAVEEPVGEGHVIFFAQNPIPRPFWQGLHRMLLAAVVFAPGGE